MANGNTVIHKLHPYVKSVVLVFYLITVLSISPYQFDRLAPFILFPAVAISLAEIPFRFIFQRILPVFPFVIFAGLSNLWFDRRIAFFMDSLPITYGAVSFITLILKTFLTVSAVLILLTTTPMKSLTDFLRSIKIPELIITQIMLSYRYITLLVDEVSVMETAYLLRSCGKQRIELKHIGSFIGQILLRSYDRATRVAFAMKCRGYGNISNISSSNPLKPVDILIGMGMIGLIFGLRVWDISGVLSRLFL